MWCVCVCVCVCMPIHVLLYFCLYLYACVCVCELSVLTLCNPWTVACQAPLSMEFFRQDYWSRSALPPSRDLLDPGIKPMSLASSALAGKLYNCLKLVFLFNMTSVPWFKIL